MAEVTEITILTIYTQYRAQSHKWELGEDGLIEYDGERLGPREVYERFLVDFPMFNVLRAETIKRIPNPEEGGRAYVWVEIERYDI